MANSLVLNGQLSNVKVRPSPSNPGSYQLVFGHRRILAAKKLGWKTIKAEIVETNDKQVATQSLVENFERKSLSDYEKALCFERLNKLFGMSYEEIGRLVGLSKQHISHYISMTNLFDPAYLSTNPDLVEVLHELTERHARELTAITDTQSRADAARLACSEELSVRELSHVVGRLRGWFTSNKTGPTATVLGTLSPQSEQQDIGSIKQIIDDEFGLAREDDFESFRRMHLFENGFSLYSGYPPLDRLENREAVDRESDWFYKIAQNSSWAVINPKIDVFHDVAVATFEARCGQTGFKEKTNGKLRVTLVLVKRMHAWKIVHEHWSEVSDAHRYFLARFSHRYNSDPANKSWKLKSLQKSIFRDTRTGVSRKSRLNRTTTPL